MIIAKWIVALAVLVVSPSCAQPDYDYVADAQAIRETNQRYIELHPQGDVAGLMELYVDDAVLMPPGEAPVVGLSNVQLSWEAFFEELTVEEAESEIDEVIVFGDWAYSRGHYAETYRSNKDGTIQVDEGKFSGLWQRQEDGSWKIARDMWNSGTAP